MGVVCTRPLGLALHRRYVELLEKYLEGQPFYRGSLLPLLARFRRAF